jgi:hypothetical protein
MRPLRCRLGLHPRNNRVIDRVADLGTHRSISDHRECVVCGREYRYRWRFDSVRSAANESLPDTGNSAEAEPS